MPFILVPVIDTMIELYQQPRTKDRFDAYLKLLQGTTNKDLGLPIGYYNPMAKDHVLQQLLVLQTMDAETIMADTLMTLNSIVSIPDINISVVLNLADDAMGGWTNRYTTDYDSKFKINALVQRHFCAPVLWTSEEHTATLIKERTTQYVLRTAYWLKHGKPQTLEEMIAQEKYVAKFINPYPALTPTEFEVCHSFYNKHLSSTDYAVIFNLMYGDKACETLGYPQLGINIDMAGFRYAAVLK